MHKNNNSGRTMIETIMFLSIIAVLAVGVISVANNVLGRIKLSRVGEQIIELSKNISTRYMSVARYTNLKTSTLIEEKIAPKDMIQGDNLLVHAYDGLVTVRGERNTFTVTFNNLPYNACFELCLLNWTMNDITGLLSISVNEDKYVWLDALQVTNNQFPLPISVIDAGVSCNNTKQNVIVWEFE